MNEYPDIARRIWYRIYEDCLMPSRLDEYKRLLSKLLHGGYTFLTIEQLAASVRSGGAIPRLSVVLRHDVDHDKRTAAAMHRLERQMGIASSYYFRLNTFDPALMQEIAAFGGEASYHFEELATVVKRRVPRNPQEALNCLPEAQDLFRTNLSRLRQQSGLDMQVVASHGDFINRRFDMPNHLLLSTELRNELGITAEVYDPDLATPVTARVSDGPPPDFWRPVAPYGAIAQTSACIYLLVHPKHWQVNIRTNARAIATRLWEGASFQIRQRQMPFVASDATNATAR
jgi:hypothetical protein